MSDRTLGPGELVAQAWKMYRPCAPLLVPTFLVAFIVLRELLLVVLLIDMPPLALLLVVTLVQAVIPAFLASLLVAAAVRVLASSAPSLRDAWAALEAQRPALCRSAAASAGLALFAAITLGPVGIIVQPIVLGPPLLVHEVALRKHPFALAWERTREMISRDTRPLAYLFIVPAAVGLLLSVTLRTFGVLSGDVPGVARGVVYFALQGALIGAAIPYVCAVGLLCYRDLASTLGGGEAAG
jgi:hypothetical protein